jgi:hypothetical protein
MKHGEEILFTLNKKEVMRKFCTNHLVHHRAQLGVYLRMLDQEDKSFLLELNENGEEIKRIDVKANPQEAMKYFQYMQEL